MNEHVAFNVWQNGRLKPLSALNMLKQDPSNVAVDITDIESHGKCHSHFSDKTGKNIDRNSKTGWQFSLTQSHR